MTTIVSIQQGGTGANNVADAINALGVLANTGGAFTGEVQFTGANTSINVSNDAIISGNVIIGENTDISGNATVSGRGLFGDEIEAHFTEKGIDGSTIIVGALSNNNGAGELMVINKSNGSLSYSEFIALNDKANQEQGWISIGINSSEYNDPSYTLTGPDDGYILFEAPQDTTANGDLVIGTGSYGQNNRIILAAGGFAPTDAQMLIAPADLKTAEIINSQSVANVATLTTADAHTFLANDLVVIADVGVPYDGQFTVTDVSSNTISYLIPGSGLILSAVANGTITQLLPFNKGTVQLTAQLFVGENSKSTIETADITLAQGHAIPLGIVVDNDGPGQTVMFNKSNGTLAYSEYIAHNDAGNVEMGWISVGINSSGYDDPEYPITKADDGYLLYEPPANTSGDGDLIIGTGTNGQKNRLIFAAQGFDEANAQMIITPDESVRISINADASSANTGALQVVGGVGVQGSVFVQGNQTIQGDLIVNGSQVIQSIASVAAAGPISLVGDGNIANTWDFGIVGTYAKSIAPQTEEITNKSLANNIATLTTANNHSFNVENYAVVTGVDATFNGTHRITGVTSNTFSFFKLANNITSTAATGNVSVSSTAAYTGVVKDTANATWKLLNNIQTRPDFNANLTNAVLDNLQVATLNASIFLTTAGLNVTNQANNAYVQANAARDQANTAYDQANLAYAQANTAYGQANAAYSQANSAYGAANNRVLKAGDTMTGQLNISSGGLLVTGNSNFDSGTLFVDSVNNKVGVGITNSTSGKLTIAQSSNTISEGLLLVAVGGNNNGGWYHNGSSLVGRESGLDTIHLAAGNVGIGITNTGYKLDVTGDIHSSNEIYLDNGKYLRFQRSSGGLSIQTLGIESGTDSVRLVTSGDFNVVNGSLTNLMTVKNGGNVGVGTTNPSVKLHVVGSSILANNTSIDPDSYANQIVAGAIADGGGFGLTSAVGGNAGTGDSWAIGHNGSALYIGVGNGSAADTMQTYVQFDPNRNLYLVPNSGNVGIGTNVPSHRLDVIINSSDTDPKVDAAVYAFGLKNSNTASGAAVAMTFGHGSYNFTNYIASIRTGTGANPTGDLVFGGRPSDGVGYVEQVRVRGTTGNVGIGTTDPGSKLDIGTGDIRANGGLYLLDSTIYGTYVRANNYPSRGYSAADNRFWLELGARGGVHVVLNTDGGAFAAEDDADDFAVFQGARDSADTLFRVKNSGKVYAKHSYYVGNTHNTAQQSEFGTSAINTVATAGTNVNTLVESYENRSGVYWLNFNGQIFRAYIKANWLQGRNWILAAKYFDVQDMPSGSSLWTNDTYVNEGDFDIYSGKFSKYKAWRYFSFDRLAMQMGNRIAPIMRFGSSQTLYGAFSGGRASNGGGVTAVETYPQIANSASYHSMTNFIGPNFVDLGGQEDIMQSYGLNKWANAASQSSAGNNQGSRNYNSGTLKGFELTIEDSHPNLSGVDSVGVNGAWIGCPMDEGGFTFGTDTSNAVSDSGFGFGFGCGNNPRTGTSGYAEWGNGNECANLLPAYIWLSID